MSSTSHTAERPERSRNAKAQARHRAKRKAYIEQLEQTVTKLQTALGCTPDDVAALPPPLAKIRDLEQENARLLKENDDLRRMLGSRGNFVDNRLDCDRNYGNNPKRRKMSDELYLSPETDILSRPPPLTIPQPSLAHHSSSYTTSAHSAHNNSLFGLHGAGFQMPHTPSGSSSTSSPPFSPAQMQAPSISPVGHRPPLSATHISNYSASNHYDSVKVEEDGYSHSSSHQQPHHNYTLPFPHSDHGSVDNWHTYSSERAQLQR
ncbi:hypothetical protein C8J56DRAFT_914954 [Mycena floridula]|nr:hypothetical protein C8J56DRAFT_914954 [Mycena floridula]